MTTCPIAWKNQYILTHKTVPESTRNMLPDLVNIEKVFTEKYNKKAKVNKAKVQQHPRLMKQACPGNVQRMGAHLFKSLRRAVLLSIATGARLMEGPIRPMIQSSVASMRKMAV